MKFIKDETSFSVYLHLLFIVLSLSHVRSFIYQPRRTVPCFISRQHPNIQNQIKLRQSKLSRQKQQLQKRETFRNNFPYQTTRVHSVSSDDDRNDSRNEKDDTNNEESIDPNTLIDMDIIIFTKKNDPTQKAYIGAIQEDMTLAPLSAWTTEPAFGNSIEFVVDEEDRWIEELELDNIIIKNFLSEGLFSYGSRQVGGGKGLGNPHGEESELVYYIENEVLEKECVEITIKPELEILW